MHFNFILEFTFRVRLFNFIWRLGPYFTTIVVHEGFAMGPVSMGCIEKHGSSYCSWGAPGIVWFEDVVIQ